MAQLNILKPNAENADATPHKSITGNGQDRMWFNFASNIRMYTGKPVNNRMVNLKPAILIMLLKH